MINLTLNTKLIYLAFFLIAGFLVLGEVNQNLYHRLYYLFAELPSIAMVWFLIYFYRKIDVLTTVILSAVVGAEIHSIFDVVYRTGIYFTYYELPYEKVDLIINQSYPEYISIYYFIFGSVFIFGGFHFLIKLTNKDE